MCLSAEDVSHHRQPWMPAIHCTVVSSLLSDAATTLVAGHRTQMGKNHRDPPAAALVRRSPPGRCYFAVMEPPSVADILLRRCCFTSSFLLPQFVEAPPLKSGQPPPQSVPTEDRAVTEASLLSPPFMLPFPLQLPPSTPFKIDEELLSGCFCTCV
ncbi:unnamed protein product [Lactuca virosa]|uniref:Uncharacterized protein n=1 Tax=Lactuca virosa TaxID=75947 RepID=A0AAU9LSB6_9ASTR|nr:unnamed protein product [Lactuca virosa]